MLAIAVAFVLTVAGKSYSILTTRHVEAIRVSGARALYPMMMRWGEDIRNNTRHVETQEIREYITRCFLLKRGECFLGLEGDMSFSSNNPNPANLCVMEGWKYDK